MEIRSPGITFDWSASQTLARPLVVGGTGQIGAQIVGYLGESCTVSGSRRATEGNIAVDLEALSAVDASELVARVAPTVVFCVGGMNDVERCEAECRLAMRTNCDGPARLAEAAAKRSTPFVHFSSDYIFDGESGPYCEEDRGNPINVYGKSKLAGELAVRNAHPGALIVRTTVVYGPDPGRRNFLFTLRNALTSRHGLRVAIDQISTATYNRDIAINTLALVHCGASGVFHMCGPERLSRYDFALKAARLMGLSEEGVIGVPTIELAQRARRPLSAGLVSKKLATTSFYCSMRTIQESIKDWLAE
jgi:dTDP-4-dehydrorhamnose reductase